MRVADDAVRGGADAAAFYAGPMSSGVGWVVPLDRVRPRAAVELSAAAGAAGFDSVLAADTFQPWLPSLGQAPFAWSLLTAIGEHVPVQLVAGMVTAGNRIHPAAVAQAAATLSALHPQGVQVTMAPGEAINEHVTGLPWPEPAERIDRMFEALDAIRLLFKNSAVGKDTRFDGRHYQIGSARLWPAPEYPPALLVATGGPATARRAGRYADGLMVVGVAADRAEHLLRKFVEGAHAAGRDPREMRRSVYVNVSWARTRAEAVQQAVDRFPIGAMRFARGDLRSPHMVEQISRLVRPDDFGDPLLICAAAEPIAEMIERLRGSGFERVFLNNVGDNHAEFIDMCGSALPELSR